MDRLASEERADIAPPVFPRYGPARKGQSGMQNGGETHFGYQSIPLEEKQGRVDDVFHSVARRYDLMNDLMSGGLHRLWKDALVTAVNPPKRTRPFKLLDLVVTFEQANAEELPYADRTFDCVTIAFGIRNMPRVERALSEAFRVLKIGGRFLCLEFSSVDVPGLDKLYELYSFQAIPRIGQVVTGDRQAYQYLVESIRKFPRAKAFAGMIERAGFRRVSFRAMTGGVVALHSGWKL
jgi:demethylmenaquinone methyltransferase / 2-methoxy-6-polyprenyl-1,4-benzoquinol methylase